MQRRSPQISGGRSSSSVSTICCYHQTRLDLKINRVFQGDRAKCRRARKPSPLPKGSLSRTSSSQSIRPVIRRSSLLYASGDTLYRSRSSIFSTSCTASYTTRALTLLSKSNSWRDAGKTTNSTFARPGVSFSPSLTAGLFRSSRSLLSCPIYLTACLYLLLFTALPLCFPPVSVVQLFPFFYTSAGEKHASVVLDSCGGSSSASYRDSIFDSVGRSSTTTIRTSTSGNAPFSYLFAEALSFAHHVKSFPLSLCTPRPHALDFLHLPFRSRAETTRPSDSLVSFWPRKSSRHSTYAKWHLPVPPKKFAFLSSRPFPLSCPHYLGAYFSKLASGSTPLEQYSYTGENVTLRQQFLPRGCYCFCLSQFPALFATTCRSHTLSGLPPGGNFSVSRVSSIPRWSILPAAAAAGVRYGQRDTRIRVNEKSVGAPDRSSLTNFPCASRTNAAGGKIRGRVAAVAADKQSPIRSGRVADTLSTSSNGNPPATTRTSSNSCRSAATCSSSSRSAATSSSKRVSTTTSSECVSTTPSSIEDIAASTSGSSSISSSPESSGSSNTSSKGCSSCIEYRIAKRATRLHNSSACRRRSSGSLEARTDAIIGMDIHRCDTAPLRVCESRSSGNRVVTSVNSSESEYGANSSMCALEEKTAGHCSNSSDDGHVVRGSGNTSVDNTSTAAGPGLKSCTGVHERESGSLGRTKGSSRTQREEGVRSSYRTAAAKDPGSCRGNGFKVNSCCRSSGGESNGSSSSIQSAQVSNSCEVRSIRENAESCSNSGGSSSSGSEGIVNRDETKAERSSFDGNGTSRGLRLAAVPTRLGLLSDLQRVQQGCFTVASAAKQLLAAVWSRWKGAAGKEGAEMTFLRSSRRRIEEVLKVVLLRLPSCAARLQAWLSITDGDGRRRSWWWSQQQQVFLSIDGRSQGLTAAAAGPTVEAAAAAAAARISAAAAARREEAAAAARIVRATIQTAAESSRTVADAIVTAAMKAVRAAGEAIGGTGEKGSWSSQWIPLVLPPPLPPVGQLLQTLLLLSYVTDSFVFKGKLLERLAFDMRRESLLRGSNSGNGCDASCARSSNRRSQRKNGGFFSASFMAFCVRAAAAGLVHSNWLHLLVNLHGIRQLLPLCERLCYDAICSSKTAVRNSAAGRFVGGAAAAAALPTSNGLFSQGWSWFWKPGAATEAAAAPATARAASAASSVAAAARRCLGGPSTVAAEKHTKGYEWLPKLSVLHGPHGREGWWARAVVMLLFTWGCAAGNVTSFYLRRWWRRMELFMEQQQRQQALKRKLWGGTFPEGDACDSDDFFEDAEAAEPGPGAAHEGGAALAAAPRGGAWAGSDAAAPSCGSSDSASDAPAAASRRGGCPAAEAEAQAAVAFFETLGGGGPARRTSSSREGREPDGTRAAATATAAAEDKEGLLQQKTSQKTGKSGLMKREEKAWERQLRLQKMRRTQQRHVSCSRETGDLSSGSGGSSNRYGVRDTAAAENWPSFGGEGVSLRAREEDTATTAEQDGTREEGEVELDDEELDEEILDETAVVADDREWCVRTVGCSAGLYSLLGLLVGSARIGSTTKKSIVKQIFKKIVTEFFMPTGVDEPGHLGGFIFGYLAANLLQW